MKETHTRAILEHVADSRYQPANLRALADDLGIDESQFDAFARAVQDLVDKGHVLLTNNREVQLPPPGREMTGTFRLNRRGFGFLAPDLPTEHGDLFVPPDSTGGALSGDIVRAKVNRSPGRAKGGRSPFTGRIVEIIKRADKHYVGNLLQRGKRFFVETDGNALQGIVHIRDPHAKDAKPGDKVVIEILEYPGDHDPGEGVITEVLGEKGQPSVETLAVMRFHGLEEAFSPEVLQQARDAASGFDEESVPADRVDLTELQVATIDPPDARDYDDAISIRNVEGESTDSLGGKLHPEAVYELGVHIADVASFVQPGTALDAEAYTRGNSTYLPRRVIPMLPELLSNGVCSLHEGVNRFAKSCFVQYDKDGKRLTFRFAPTVIKSEKRFTYLEAQAIIDGDLREAPKHAKTEPHYPRPVVKMLRRMDELAKKIRARRMSQGMIVLGLPDVELVFSDSGHVIDAVPEDDAFTHTIIEMFMVEANEAAAELFNAVPVPMVRRIHPDPPVHDIADLRQFARVAGFNIPDKPSRIELQQLLERVRGKPSQHAVHIAVLKTLSKAEYSPLNIGHFALASEHYTHFTSPIRRYTDLVVHRAIEAYFEAHKKYTEQKLPTGRQLSELKRKLTQDSRVPDEKRLHEIGGHCSSTERNSESAERELRTYLVLDLLAEQHLGDDFPGVVSGVTNDCIFIQLDKYLVDGMLRVSDISGTLGHPGERWRLNRQTGALVAQRSGKAISIGDRFIVRISRVDPAHRQLDLALIGLDGEPRQEGSSDGGNPNRTTGHKVTQRKQQRGKSGRAAAGKGGEGGSSQPGRKSTSSQKGRRRKPGTKRGFGRKRDS